MRTNTHDYGHGGAYVRKREVRAFAHVCSPMAFIVALLAVLLVPTIALADSSIIWGPSAIPNAENGIIVNAPDRYRAAAVALGYGDDAYSAWSDDVKAKLSNASTGGRFYQFAQLFGEVGDAVGNDNPLTAVVSAVGNSFWSIAETLYGDDIWLAGYSSDLLAGAASDLSAILAGDNIGGGGSSGDEVDGYTILRGGNENGYQFGLVPVAAGGAGSYILDISQNTNDIDKWRNANLTIAVGAKRVNDSTVTYPIFIGFETGINLVRAPNGSVGLYNSSDSTKKYNYIRYETSRNWTASASGLIMMTWGYNETNSNVTLASKTFTTIYNTYLSQIDYFCCQGGTAEPVVPPSNWPDEPEAPEPPELPEPSNPVVEPPEPYEPSTGPTFIWNITNTSEPTDTSSLLEWIKKIFYELKAIHSDLKTWFQNLGTALTDGFEAMDDACGQIYDAITENTDELQDQFQSLKTYLKQLFQWLGDKMNFQANGYDDTSVIYWLKRIWSKLGNGDINLRPTDPTNDPDDWWDWLVKAIQNFLIGLAATSTELISEIADLASQVMHEFPFSIPWDIAAVLAALSTSPVTPVFTITIPAVNGWWASFDIVIDMSPYNGAAETIRLMEKLLFTGLLIWKSKELLDFMDVTRWFD